MNQMDRSSFYTLSLFENPCDSANALQLPNLYDPSRLSTHLYPSVLQDHGGSLSIQKHGIFHLARGFESAEAE